MKYKVKLASLAARTYENMHLAAGEGGTGQANAVQQLETLLNDFIPSHPFTGIELPGSLSGTRFISRSTIQLIYEVHPKILTVTILLILDAPAREENARRADVICTKMLLSGQVRILPLEIGRRAATN